MIDRQAQEEIGLFEREEDIMPESDCVEMKTIADDKRLHDVLSFIEGELEKREAGMKQTMALTLAVEEAFVNIAHYAYEGKEEPGEVLVRLEFKGDEVAIILKDQGMEFDPLAKEDPDITIEAKNRQIGGLGIYMIKQSTDSVMYERKDGFNILTMKKVVK